MRGGGGDVNEEKEKAATEKDTGTSRRGETKKVFTKKNPSADADTAGTAHIMHDRRRRDKV